MKAMVRLSIAVSFLLMFLTTFPVHAQESATSVSEPANYVQVRLIPARSPILPGETFFVAVEQVIYPGWHTYWKNPGDSGAAPRIKWNVPEGFELAPLKYPVPRRIDVGGLTSYGYEDQVSFLQMVTAPDPLPEGALNFSAEIEVLVCEEICIPEVHTDDFALNGEEHFDNEDFISQAFNKMPLAFDWDTTYFERNDHIVVDFELETFGYIGVGKPTTYDILPYEWGIVDNAAKSNVRKILPKEKNGYHHIVVAKKRGDRPLASLGPIKVLVTFETDEQYNAFEFTAHPDPRWVKLLASQSETATLQESDSGQATDQTAGAKESNLSSTMGVGIVKALILAFLGGLVLNLMPCVFPVLSMKALSLCRLSEKSKAHARLYGVTYTLGILVSFAAMAGLLMALKAAGTEIGWGFQLQNPVAVLVLTYLFFALALNLSGFFEIGGGFTNIGSGLASHEGLVGSFFTGVLATIVATPCTAPFMGVAMGFALAQPAFVAMTVFLVLGLGLAFPFLLFAMVPSLQKALPKPGLWMEVFREFLAFPMYLSVAWLVWVYSQQIGEIGALYALIGMITIGFTVWVFRMTDGAGIGLRIVFRLISVLVLLAVGGLTIFASQADIQDVSIETAQSGSIAYTPESFKTALDGDHPVFVNMTADWCLTCKVNERVALGRADTKALFAAKKVIYIKGDWTNRNADITSFLSSYGRSGVPIYVYYGPRDIKTGNRPEPKVLPQILTPGMVEDIINQGDIE